jgi:hypothetical protein
MKKVGALIALGVLCIASVASAQDKKTDITISGQKGALTYAFPDGDQLTGSEMGAAGAQIRVAKFANRQMLMRPRGSFIPELLKSVENM